MRKAEVYGICYDAMMLIV